MTKSSAAQVSSLMKRPRPQLANSFANKTPGSSFAPSDQGYLWCRRGDLHPNSTHRLQLDSTAVSRLTP
jgi:hypothetical protein